MNKISTLALALSALFSMNVYADDFTVLSSPADVLKYSIEDVDGAKETFRAVIENSSSTADEINAAMETYQQNATPAPGYAFNMSFLLYYNVVTAENKPNRTQLAKYWSSDIADAVPDPLNTTLQVESSEASNGIYMRAYSASAYKSEDSFGKFAAYQSVDLAAGNYVLEADAFLKGDSNCATLSAGDNNSSDIAGAPMRHYSVNFKLSAEESVKLGFKRNSRAGNLTHICFNNMYLYKVSPVVVISDEATGALTAAAGVDVLLKRSFNADEYYLICLPFVVENWRDVFDDILLMNTFTEKGELSFRTISSADTQYCKPYLVKMKEDINEDNYLVFKNVTIKKGNAGSWTVNNSDISLKGNWAAGTVPAGSYYLSNGEWLQSDGTEPLIAFSAYVNAPTALSYDKLPMLINGKGDGDIQTGIEDVIVTSEETVNVYNMQGIIVKRGVSAENPLEGLASGLYIVNGKKIVK